MKKSNQQGVTFIAVVLIMLAIGFVGIIGIRFIPVYLKHYSVVASMKSLENDPPSTVSGGSAKMGLESALLRRLYINNISDINGKDIKVTLVNGGYMVRVVYDAQVKMVANIDAVVHFDDSVTVPFRGT